MDNSTRRMINSLAEDVLSAYNISVPIGNIDEIVEKLGGTIQKEAFFSDGAVEKEGNGFKIIVSPFQDEKRERFTIAHELGHLFLHMGYRTNNELWEKQENNIYHRIGNSEKEYQANEFAAAFLMPATEYLAVLNKVAEGNMVDTSKIAEYFNVSIEAAANDFVALRLRYKILDFLLEDPFVGIKTEYLILSDKFDIALKDLLQRTVFLQETELYQKIIAFCGKWNKYNGYIGLKVQPSNNGQYVRMNQVLMEDYEEIEAIVQRMKSEICEIYESISQ